MYTVKPGDCLTSIAAAHGFQDYKVIYNHADNKDFRKKRPNPHIIHPGDQIFIPPVKPLSFKVPVGGSKKMEVKHPPAELQVFIKDADGEPFKSKAYKISFPPRTEIREGTTAGDGLLKEMLPAHAAHARVEFEDEGVVFQFRLGNLDPVREPSGLRGRLKNLGYAVSEYGDDEEQIAAATKRALARFQAHHDLPPTGNLNKKTVAALKDKHDGGVES